MILIVYLFVRAHEPYARVIVVALCSIAVIPLTIKLYEEPVVNISVVLRITVDSHVRNAGCIKKHLAACIVNVAVTAVSCKSSVSGSFIIRRSGEKSEPQIVVNPVEDCSCSLNIVSSYET